MKKALLALVGALALVVSCSKDKETPQPQIIAVTGVTVSPATLPLVVGETGTLSATVAPSNATDKTVTWTTSSSAVATVADGVVTAVAPGEATITAKAGDKTGICTVTVSAPEPVVIAVTGITLNTDILELIEGESAILTATVYPENATDPSVTWKSSSEAVATVVDGVVTAVAAGEATITAKAGDKAVACTVTVVSAYVAVESITLDAVELSLEVGESMTLISTVLPENATDKMVTWSSGDESIATVADGVVTAIAPGQTVITAKAGDVEATCAVTVAAESSPATTTVASLKFKELPPMAVPRKGHVSFATADGDVVVVGGHTYGFALTSTAERLHNGQWESLDIANPHDGGAGITLPDGRVLICGGFSSGLGVGQSTVCDIYDPSTHTFYSAANLVESRAASSGVLTGVGNEVLLSGNWYNSDTYFELWDGTSWTSFGSKDMQMYNPFMVSDGNGIVYVFGCYSNYGGHYDPALYKVNTKDRIVETLEYAGVEGCTPWAGSNSVEPVASLTADGKLLFIGQTEDYEHPYVLMSFDPATAKFAKLIDLPSGVEGVDSFYYSPGVLVNKSRGEAYIIGGYGSGEHQSVVVINYKLSTGSQIIYHGGDFNNGFLGGSWVLLPDSGDIVFTGGSISDNFNIQNPAIIVTPFE